MGKTTQPITILAVGMEKTPALLQMEAEGHVILEASLEDIMECFAGPNTLIPDVIVSPKAWRYLPDVSDKWLHLLLKEARATQPVKPKSAKRKKASDGATTS